MSQTQLEFAAGALEPVLDEVVFLGGATIHVWVSETGSPPTRATNDVDVICDVATKSAYDRFGERLREGGLYEDSTSSVICRWRDASSNLAIDVMPVSEDVLGFSNPWYRGAIKTAVRHDLASGRSILVASPPYIVATKLAAWLGRGGGDVMRSLDLHDLVALVNGRPELADEIAAGPEDVRAFAARELEALRIHPAFDYVLESAVSGYGSAASQRAGVLRARFAALVERVA